MRTHGTHVLMRSNNIKLCGPFFSSEESGLSNGAEVDLLLCLFSNETWMVMK